MSYHKNFDAYEEERLAGKSFGSTKSGIAPFYSDKFAKIGFQVSELFDDALLREKVERVAQQKNVLLEHLYHKPLIDPEDLYQELKSYKEMVEPYVCDTALFIHNALQEGKSVLLEGQLGSLKDPGPRDLSHGNLIFDTCRLRRGRSRCPASGDPADHYCLQSIFQRGRSRGLCQRDLWR